MVGTAIFGIPVTNSLSAGGVLDPTSESSQAAKLLSDKFGQGDMPMIISVTSDGGVESPAARAVGTDIVQRLQASPHVAQVTSAWTTPSAPSLISKDHRTGLIVAGISGSDNETQKYAKQLADQLVHDRDGVTVRAGGEGTIYWQIEAQTKKDLLLMESIAMPLSFVVLVWVFGGLVAAALPMAVGGFAILGSMAVLHTVSLFTNVSIFALNLAVALGLALAIDYTLLILSRYRDELAAGADRGCGVDPHHGDGGPHRVVLGDDGRVVDGHDGAVPAVLPEVVRVRGRGRGHVRRVRGDRRDARCDRAARRPSRLARRAQAAAPGARSPGPAAEAGRADVLVSLDDVRRCATPCRSAPRSSPCCSCSAAPFLGVRWGFPDDRVLPASASARQVGDRAAHRLRRRPGDQHHRGGAARGTG